MHKIFMVVNEDRFFLSHRLPVALAAREKGYDVTIVAKNTGSKDSIVGYGFDFIDLPINPTGMNLCQEYKTYRFLSNLYASNKPDIVHHVGLKNILWGGLAAKNQRIRGVVNAVSGLGGLFNGGKLNIITRNVLNVIRYSNNRSGVAVIFQNNEDKDIFLKSKAVKEDQVYFTHGSGINLDEYVYVEEPSDSIIKIIFTGRMVKEKGICDLIEAAEILKEKYFGQVKFILCGRLTPNKSGLTSEYLNIHCDDGYVSWLGERNDVKQLLEESHIVAFPSYYREGVPKSLIEAAAVGRAIVTCDSIGCRDVVADGINGFLIPPQSPQSLAEAIVRLVENPAMRKEMGIASRKKAEQDFSIKKVVETHMKIYDELTLEF